MRRCVRAREKVPTVRACACARACARAFATARHRGTAYVEGHVQCFREERVAAVAQPTVQLCARHDQAQRHGLHGTSAKERIVTRRDDSCSLVTPRHASSRSFSRRGVTRRDDSRSVAARRGATRWCTGDRCLHAPRTAWRKGAASLRRVRPWLSTAWRCRWPVAQTRISYRPLAVPPHPRTTAVRGAQRARCRRGVWLS